MNCTCAGYSETITLCSEHHVYKLGDRELVSVSAVIRESYPSDYSMVAPEVLENARARGSWIDKHFSEFIAAGHVDTEGDPEWTHRLELLMTWWDKQGLCGPVASQQILYDEEIGVAGTADLILPDAIWDLKCTSKLMPAYKQQLGAYLSMSGKSDAAILHVTKTSVRLVRYDAQECRKLWRTCVANYFCPA